MSRRRRLTSLKNWTLRGLAYDPTQNFLRYPNGTVNHWDKIGRPGVLLERRLSEAAQRSAAASWKPLPR